LIKRSEKMIRLGILGFGTVGTGVVSIINKHSNDIKRKIGTDIKIKKILVNRRDKKRDINLEPEIITDKVDDILTDPEIDIVIELIGGEEPAHQYIIRAIKEGKSVVTANKLVMAKYGSEILKLAREKRVHVSYEGSVAGGIPVIRPLKESFAANRIEELYGILNGTTNYILSKMTRNKRRFADVLEEAQKLGYAEKEPSSDISGLDAAYKIAILSSIAFETAININDISVEGIDKIELEDINLAGELGYVIKLLAIAKRFNGGLDIRVHPAFISKEHPLALVNDVYNAIYLHGDAVGDVMSYGKGAGQMPTASAVVADIINVGQNIFNNRPDISINDRAIKEKVINIIETENLFYLRIQVNDKPGVLAQITKVFGDNLVSLASVIQKHRLTPVVPIVLITHRVKEEYMKKALKELEELNDVITINNLIRVEEL
jgi:homoserine dehydrogenase